MEDSLATWLESLGLEVNAATRKSIAGLCRSNVVRALQFMMEKFKPIEEKEDIDQAVADWQRKQEAESSAPSMQQQLKELEEELARKTAQEEALRRTLASFQVRSCSRRGAMHHSRSCPPPPRAWAAMPLESNPLPPAPHLPQPPVCSLRCTARCRT